MYVVAFPHVEPGVADERFEQVYRVVPGRNRRCSPPFWTEPPAKPPNRSTRCWPHTLAGADRCPRCWRRCWNPARSSRCTPTAHSGPCSPTPPGWSPTLEVAEPARQAIARVAQTLTDLPRSGQHAGDIRADLDPAAGAWWLLTLLSAGGFRAAAMPHHAALESQLTALTLGMLTSQE